MVTRGGSAQDSKYSGGKRKREHASSVFRSKGGARQLFELPTSCSEMEGCLYREKAEGKSYGCSDAYRSSLGTFMQPADIDILSIIVGMLTQRLHAQNTPRRVICFHF